MHNSPGASSRQSDKLRPLAGTTQPYTLRGCVPHKFFVDGNQRRRIDRLLNDPVSSEENSSRFAIGCLSLPLVAAVNRPVRTCSRNPGDLGRVSRSATSSRPAFTLATADRRQTTCLKSPAMLLLHLAQQRAVSISALISQPTLKITSTIAIASSDSRLL